MSSHENVERSTKSQKREGKLIELEEEEKLQLESLDSYDEYEIWNQYKIHRENSMKYKRNLIALKKEIA